ncbi:hypothetical protein FI667_g13700, partial [Globisporangium splendens]
MASFKRIPVVRAALLLLLFGTLSTGALTASNDTGCAICRDTGNCETAHNDKPGKFCNMYDKLDFDSDKRLFNESVPCCCGVEDTCRNHPQLCSCEIVLTPQTPRPTRADVESDGFWTTSRIVLFVGGGVFAVAAGVGYYFWMKTAAKKVFGPTGMPQVYVAHSDHVHHPSCSCQHDYSQSGVIQQTQQAYGTQGNDYNSGGGSDHQGGAATSLVTAAR